MRPFQGDWVPSGVVSKPRALRRSHADRAGASLKRLGPPALFAPFVRAGRAGPPGRGFGKLRPPPAQQTPWGRRIYPHSFFLSRSLYADLPEGFAVSAAPRMSMMHAPQSIELRAQKGAGRPVQLVP
eukprot:3566363-Pyramimonas_sp.AAC.1